MHRHHQHHLWSAWRILALAATSSLAFACSGGEVDLGSGLLSRDLSALLRCTDPSVVDAELQITSQSDLDALRGCERVHGLRIEPFADIDLTALASLRIVTDALELGTTPLGLPEDFEEQQAFLAEDRALLESGWVDNLRGLEALESVETLYATGIAIESFAELESLTSVGTLLATNTPRLRDFSGLQRATVDEIWVTNAPELESLDGLRIPQSIATLIFMAVPRLANIDAIVDIEYADTVILSGTGLTTLPSFSGLVGMENLNIDNNADLTNIDSLGAVQVGNSIYIAANPRLASIPRFENLISFDRLSIVGNDAVETLDLDFPALQPDFWFFGQTEVPINPPLIEIGYNAALERITLHQSLPSLQFLSIFNHDALTEVDFGGLTIAGAMFIDQNPALSSALTPSLRSVDRLEITNNPQLSLAAFDEVQTVVHVFTGNADADPAAPDEPSAPVDSSEPAAP